MKHSPHLMRDVQAGSRIKPYLNMSSLKVKPLKLACHGFYTYTRVHVFLVQYSDVQFFSEIQSTVKAQ